jgi:aspartate aminotransferase
MTSSPAEPDATLSPKPHALQASMQAHHGPQASPRAQDMPRSPIRRIFNAARELEADGVDVIRLDIGDPDFTLPPRVSAGISASLARGETHYSPMAGVPALREAIGGHLKRRHSLPASAETVAHHVVVNQGATQALNSALNYTCGLGDSILLPEIYFPNYIQQCTLAGVRPRFYPLDAGYVASPAGLARADGERVRAVLMNSPGNPTGAVFPAGIVSAIQRFCVEHGLWLISDEAYCDMVFEGETLLPLVPDWQLAPEARCVISVFSFSKSYAATGLRLGWMLLPTLDAAGTLSVMNEPFTGSLTTPLQWGMVEALRVDDAAERREALRPRWRLTAQALRDSGLPFEPPGGGLFFFVDVSATGLSGEDFALRLLREHSVAVVPGAGFSLVPHYGADGRISFAPNPRAERCVRLCFGGPAERLAVGVERMVSFIRERL